MEKKRATIKDLQKETGLSLGTISKYLNNGSLKKQNRELIEDAIKRLDFHVDPYARSMITGKTNTIGVVVPELGNAFYGLIASYFDKYLRQNNYGLVVKEYNNDYKNECNCIKWFIERKMDAIIVFTIGNINKEFYQQLDYKNIIFVDNKIDDIDFDFIGTNNYEISKQAVSYLIENGHKKIIGLFVEGCYTAKERYRGYQDALKEHNIEVDDNLVYFTGGSLEETSTIVADLILKKDYSAVYASNYISTLAILFMLNEKSMKVPDDISLLGFDNIMLTNIFTPKITIVEQPLKQIAKTVSDRICELANGSTARCEIYLKSEIQVGLSVKKIN